MRVVAFFLLLAVSLVPAAFAGTFATRCVVQKFSPILDSLSYRLYVTVPTTGYHFALVGTRVKGNVVSISVRYRLDPGLHGQVLETHRIRFTLVAPHFANRYTVTANGRKLGRPKAIVFPKSI